MGVKMASAYDTIHGAIRNKQNISATYKGYYREMSPHVLGHKKGRAHALLYQFGGDSKSGLAPVGSPANWRCVFVEELEDVKVQGGDFQTAPNHSRPQTCVDQIDIEVKF